jgi:putative transposase
MKRSKFSEEQVAYALRQVEAGTPVGDVCRQLGVSEATFYAWKKKYAHLGVSELRRLRQLEDENGRLKRLVADLTLDKHMLSEALRKTREARAPSGTGRVVSGDVPGQLRASLSAGAVQPGRVVSPESGAGPVGAAPAYSRARSRAATLRVPPDLGPVAPRRLGRES